ncbi:helix-turn-helix transcriptional regulator [Eubacterium sp. 1001713B170207_170306_E7]|uniref:helix-turn-helix domain-containing protein n=1 Tax=Eubacterium sp. 1001713B170207_170306_E7 TaxID=2787097 RepID=UPI00189BC068|nr:helix-turn-helix transcriptional regulator [Eubacterium sp. 1001713B170207_170306_E7]
MNKRIFELRKKLKLNQEDFGAKIGLSKSAISSIEKGDRNVNERHITMICSEYNVNETWLRTGIGEMFVKPQTTREKLDRLIDEMDYEELRMMSSFIDCLMEIKSETIKDFPYDEIVDVDLKPVIDTDEDDAYIVRAAHNDNEDPDQVEKMNNDISRLEEKARKRKLER